MHRSKNPFSSSTYRPELDASIFCFGTLTTVYQNTIGMLRFIVELDRIDIQYEVSLLSQYLVQPRKGHLRETCNALRYLKKKYTNGYAVMDPDK